MDAAMTISFRCPDADLNAIVMRLLDHGWTLLYFNIREKTATFETDGTMLTISKIGDSCRVKLVYDPEKIPALDVFDIIGFSGVKRVICGGGGKA